MSKNPKGLRKKLICIFLEGKTEDVFYKKITDRYLKSLPKKYKNLQTGTNINVQIARNLYHFIEDSSNSEYDLYVYAFIDREGARSDVSEFDGSAILKELKKLVKIDTIKEIATIEAIFMIESWFFHDLEGICRYINLPYTETLKRKYSNAERFTSTHLSELFKKGKGKKHYKKGDEGFLNSLDIEKIYNNCSDLRNGIECIVRHFNEKY
jgi:hypothetical protein